MSNLLLEKNKEITSETILQLYFSSIKKPYLYWSQVLDDFYYFTQERGIPTFTNKDKNIFHFLVKEFSLTLATQQNLINASADASVLTQTTQASNIWRRFSSLKILPSWKLQKTNWLFFDLATLTHSVMAIKSYHVCVHRHVNWSLAKWCYTSVAHPKKLIFFSNEDFFRFSMLR